MSRFMDDEEFKMGREAAQRIWHRTDDSSGVQDPRRPAFAMGVLNGFAEAAEATGRILRDVIENAGASAEGLNIDVFQGIVEVLQNADDLDATEVRIALAGNEGHRQLLIVHDGAPVTCHHVLPMVLPFLTTKSGEADLKGRFGIGLKTLGRIAEAMTIHSAPYHFVADGLNIAEVDPEPPVPGFYTPGPDTLLRLDLVSGFEPEKLRAWFDDWNEDGLLFLRSVKRFAWRDLESADERAKAVNPGDWSGVRLRGGTVTALEKRRVEGSEGSWTVYKAIVPTDPSIPRSHKATASTTALSFALADHAHETGVFVAFRTRLPVNLPFSIDGQFDPSTAREGLIENEWNKWLIARCGEALEEIASGLLLTSPADAWSWVPIPDETIGTSLDTWLQSAVATTFGGLRERLSSVGRIGPEPAVPLSRLAFEDHPFQGLLDSAEVRALAPEHTPTPDGSRDPKGRWRAVLSSLNGPLALGAEALADGFSVGAFGSRDLSWWADAAARLTQLTPDLVFGLPCWRSDAGRAIACHERDETSRPLVLGDPLSAFTRRWNLLDRLHDDYAGSEHGQSCLTWLNSHAAVVALVDAKVDLAAFAERFADDPQSISDDDLRDLRDRFDLLSDRAAKDLGLKVGAALRLDGYVFKAGKRQDCKVAPTEAYLSKTLEGENAYWPVAAGSLPGLRWLASSYDDRLKSGATRTSRKRADGVISRGPRRFLLLLGAATAPRLQRSVAPVFGGSGVRRTELAGIGADHVDYDVTSPDLDRVITSLAHASKKDRKVRGPALVKAVSRNWDVYADDQMVSAYKNGRVYRRHKGHVTAAWLNQLRQSEWMVVGGGELISPDAAVVRSQSTQSMYSPSQWLVGIGPDDLKAGFVSSLKLITAVRASDLVSLLEDLRASGERPDSVKTLSVYRALAKQPLTGSWPQRLGDLEVSALRARFAAKALIWVERPDGSGDWKMPSQVLTGRDIFHDPTRFVPGGPSCADLWKALAVRAPGLDDCLSRLRELGTEPYNSRSEAVLIETYRFMEGLVAGADRRQREKLRALPVGSAGGWITQRPILQLDDRELRQQLSAAYPDLHFWNPPCDTQALPHVTAALGLSEMAPRLSVPASQKAREWGEVMADRFRSCVDHLSNELMRNAPATREALSISWSELRDLPLQVHEELFEVRVSDPALVGRDLKIRMGAVLQREPLRLDVAEAAFMVRDSCGRAVASLFPKTVRHWVEAEWVASWIASGAAAVERLVAASDEDIRKALEDQAANIDVSAVGKIKVTKPASRMSKTVAPRRLKSEHSGEVTVEVHEGTPAEPPSKPSRPLLTDPPPPSGDFATPAVSEPLEYSKADLEQRGWEILRTVLANASDGPLSDFRRRHRVGADGALGWRKFVELKAAARGPQSSVEFTASEFERAQEEGVNFMLALVSGLEEGFETRVRIILDPTRKAAVRPFGSVRLSGLQNAPAVVLTWGEGEKPVEDSPSNSERFDDVKGAAA